MTLLLLTGEHLTKSYVEKKLLDDASFTVESGDKIGIVGPNGAGKTTLLRLLVGQDTPDTGAVRIIGKVRVGYLPQNSDFDPSHTVLQQVLEGVRSAAKEYECKTILNKLGLSDYDAKIGTLSGGQKKRVALAAALVHEVDLLVLDEPTNHIDSGMVAWLEKYLAAYKGALLMVTHDRYFLDRVTNCIWELAAGKIYRYPCNYTAYLEQKAQREEMAASSQRKLQSLIRREVQWIQQGPCARGTKSQYRIDRLAQLRSRKEGPARGTVEMDNLTAARLGKKILEIEHLSKGFDGTPLIEDFSYTLLRTDRIGIIGENGVGKSTLLKLLMGELTPDAGTVVQGETVKIGYFSQQCEEMDLRLRAIDYIRNESDAVETKDGTLSATQLMETFFFTPEEQYTSIGRLSGGERRRLYLLKILMQAPNVLVLDEPTNDLDIETLTILEDYLTAFAGAVLLVSHDRYFLDKTATQIFSFEDGTVRRYVGGYTDWEIQREALLAEAAPAAKQAANPGDKPTAQRSKNKSLRFSYKEEREFATIDADIAALEQKMKDNKAAVQAAATDFVRLQQLAAEGEALQAQLAEKEERWIYLTELNERIQNGGAEK